MAISPDRTHASRILISVGPLVTLAITPWMSYDPINIPKLAVLAVCAAVVLILMLLNIRLFLESRYRATVLVSGFFGLDLLIVLFLNHSPFSEHFFGTFGRNTGFLTYVSLLVLFMASALSFQLKSIEKLLWALVGTGFVSAIYGVLQSLGKDPYKWINPFSPVIGFLGNPDFQSSLLGMCGVVIIALLLHRERRLNARVLLGIFMILLLYVISKTKAQQGILILAAGGVIVFYIYVLKSQWTKLLKIPYLAISVLTSILVLVGTLNKGPLGHILYKPSVTFRGDYWHAGWTMTVQHPFLGVGLDSYGEWYRASRTVVATLRRGPDMVSNAAHNVLLDFSSNGGFPFLIAYLLIVGLALISAIRVVRRSKHFDAIHTGLFGAWVAYQAQSVISLNQLGLVVWGWIFSGALIAYEISTRPIDEGTLSSKVPGKSRKSRNVKVQNGSPAVSVAVFAGLMLGLALALPPFLADANFRSSLSSGSAATLQAAATRWPIDDYRLVQAGLVMKNSKLDTFALNLARMAAKRNPRSFDAWREISTNKGSTPAEKSAALHQMKILDPHNPNLK